MKTREEIQTLTDFLIETYAAHTGAIALARLNRLKEIKLALEKTYPVSSKEVKKLSLLPSVFQECNYDGDDLANPKFTLVKDLLDLDFYLAFGGKERTEVTPSEFQGHYQRVMHR